MVKAVLDTNVLVSATLFGGNPEKILNLAREGKIEILSSETISKEFRRVLQEKFGFSSTMAELTASEVGELSTLTTPTQKLNVIRQKEADNRVLQCGVEGKAGYIFLQLLVGLCFSIAQRLNIYDFRDSFCVYRSNPLLLSFSDTKFLAFSAISRALFVSSREGK